MTGVDNTVADWLTFEGDERVEKFTGRQFHPLAYDYPSNDALSDRFLSFFPQDVPRSFRISHLPPEILFFAQRAAEILSLSVNLKEKRATNELIGIGSDGPSSSPTPCSITTPLLMEYPQTKYSSLSRFSLSSSKKATFPSQEKLLADVRSRWWERLSARPPSLWRRRSGNISAGVPFTEPTKVQKRSGTT